eukprot:SAG25_NODE_12334_length_282_cov_0.808743_1_plen_88_part_01
MINGALQRLHFTSPFSYGVHLGKIASVPFAQPQVGRGRHSVAPFHNTRPRSHCMQNAAPSSLQEGPATAMPWLQVHCGRAAILGDAEV